MKSSVVNKILVVDDTSLTLEVIQRNLSAHGYQVFLASHVNTAVEILKNETLDLVITDLKMPQISGIELVKHVKNNYPGTAVMMITGYPSINNAVESVKAGVEEYLSKPFTADELFEKVEKILKTQQLLKVNENDHSFSKLGLIGSSEKMNTIFSDIKKAAQIDATVLIKGESGTGKEVVARAIHYCSSRSSTPFVPVNCSAIPENLIESELFGYVKGAFTGAVTNRAGFFQTAQNGTIFLDEISNTSANMQSKLLRVIQEKQFYMLGSNRPHNIELRIIAATNKDLYEMIQSETFREDLYYRLNVITINIPSLSEHKEDIILLVDHFNKKFSQEYNKSAIEFSSEVLKVFLEYDWPGNIRELENMILRLVVMNDDNKICVSDLPEHMRFSINRSNDINKTLEEVEKEHIHTVLNHCGGNKSKAAEILKISRKTLREKLK